MLEERRAYHMNNYISYSVQKFFLKFNHNTQEELKTKKLQYDFQNLSRKFENIVTVNNAVATVNVGEYAWMDIM